MKFFAFAAAVYLGNVLIIEEFLDYSVIYKITQSLTLSAWYAGAAVAFTPEIVRGIASAKEFLQLLNRVPKIRDNSGSQESIISEHADVYYKNVKFSYPSRLDVPILQGLDLHAIQGKTIALVGPSGCGKSTIIQLLQRLYDSSSGIINIDEENIKNLKLSHLRMHLGIVSQEPNLFDRTILENIAYGHNLRIVSEEECIEAAKKANIHNFIVTLPLLKTLIRNQPWLVVVGFQGYETRLGERGIQLSGGEKQRVAIARALIRDPNILLLDEATSALDSKSERVVQEALDKARKGKTCIIVAHRLKTIQEADVICIVDKGVVAEMGNHHELLEQKGIYYRLRNMRTGRNDAT